MAAIQYAAETWNWKQSMFTVLAIGISSLLATGWLAVEAILDARHHYSGLY